MQKKSNAIDCQMQTNLKFEQQTNKNENGSRTWSPAGTGPARVQPRAHGLLRPERALVRRRAQGRVRPELARVRPARACSCRGRALSNSNAKQVKMKTGHAPGVRPERARVWPRAHGLLRPERDRVRPRARGLVRLELARVRPTAHGLLRPELARVRPTAHGLLRPELAHVPYSRAPGA